MSTEKMQASFRLLMLITTPKLAEKALLLFEKGRLPTEESMPSSFSVHPFSPPSPLQQ